MITSPELADALNVNNRRNEAAKAVLDTVDEFGLHVRPQFPHANDTELKRYFVIDVPDAEVGEKVSANLQRRRGVEAVYQKPPDELPT